MTAEPIPQRRTLCIDFDGVIHSYERGWQGGALYSDVVAGFFDWAEQARLYDFELVVYSSRSKDPALLQAMEDWLLTKYRAWRAEQVALNGAPREVASFIFAREKPAAWLTIDDRCIRFDGRWEDPELHPMALAMYRPWTQLQGARGAK